MSSLIRKKWVLPLKRGLYAIVPLDVGVKGLTFKGGTALSKIYFPQIWRLSEDLDFVYKEDFKGITDVIPIKYLQEQKS